MKSIKTASVRMVGPDDQMDHKGEKRRPANPLPVKCLHCTFPDLDYVAKPYLLSRGVASPAETSNALMGNFLVRERVKRILELAVPGACTFHPTAELKSKAAAPWWLAVPVSKLKTLVPKPKRPSCSKCGEAKNWGAHMGEVWQRMNQFDSRGVDVFKSLSWETQMIAEDDFQETNEYRKEGNLPPLPWSHWDVEPPPHPQRWTRRELDRELYFSVRLEQLFKRAKVKGRLVRLAYFSEVKPSPEDESWIQEKLRLLGENGLVDAPKAALGKSSGVAAKWFAQFLKRHAKKGIKAVDFGILEKKHKLTLPTDYKEFIANVGPKSFADVCDMEGSTTSIQPPQKLDFKNYRRGKVPHLEGDDAKVDGVMFATTDHGDCFVFDVSAKGSDFPVYWHRHEENTLEQFAPNFAGCVKRFAQKN
jgi:hypothetical protein